MSPTRLIIPSLAGITNGSSCPSASIRELARSPGVPLGWGRLTGKIGRGKPLPKTSRLHVTADRGPPLEDEYLFKVIDALEAVSHETDKTVSQIALNWLLERPTVSTLIIGARKEEQLKQNLGAVGWKLTQGQIKRLDDASARSPAYPYWHQRNDFSERNPPPV